MNWIATLFRDLLEPVPPRAKGRVVVVLAIVGLVALVVLVNILAPAIDSLVR